MVNRRGFLTTLASAAAAALTLDPERALWVPGARLISVPAPAPAPIFTPHIWSEWDRVMNRQVLHVINLPGSEHFTVAQLSAMARQYESERLERAWPSPWPWPAAWSQPFIK